MRSFANCSAEGGTIDRPGGGRFSGESSFDVVLAAGVEQLLKPPVVFRPPELAAGRREGLDRPALLPALAFLIGAGLRLGRDPEG